jgi:hypothetical protein
MSLREKKSWTISTDVRAFPMAKLRLEYLAFSTRRGAMVDARVGRALRSNVFLSGACDILRHLCGAGDRRRHFINSNTRQTRGEIMCS